MPKKEDSSASKQGTKYFKVIEKKKAFRIRQNEAINLAIEYGDTNNPETLKWIINKMINFRRVASITELPLSPILRT